MQVEMSTIQTPDHTEMRQEGNDCRHFQRIHCAPGIVLSVLHILNDVDCPTTPTPSYDFPHPSGHKCEAFRKLHLP